MLNFRGLTMIYMAILPDCLVKFFAEKRILRAVTYGEGHPNLTDVRTLHDFVLQKIWSLHYKFGSCKYDYLFPHQK